MTEQLIFRPARESDYDQIGALYQISPDGVAVKDALRSRGIGGLLMAQAEADCHDKGFDKLSLLVFDQNLGQHYQLVSGLPTGAGS